VGAGLISLYLKLCYAECTTRPVPIPGEPCRTEDQLMADSRVAEDFRLELRDTAPKQVEEDALRDFVAWLRANVQLVDTTPPPAGDDASWLAALRPAAQPWFLAEGASPPTSPPPSVDTLGDYLFDLAPPGLFVAADRLCDFLRVAFRFWVTELRPMWMAMRCHRPAEDDVDCVLLARVAFNVQWIGGAPGGAWQVVDKAASIVIDETRRPILAHQRLLQEWALCGCDCAGLGSGATGGASPPHFVPHVAADTSRVAFRVTTAALTLDDTDYCVVCSGGGASLAVTLPASNGSRPGRIYVVKNVDITSVTVTPAAGNKIDGAANLKLKKGAAATLLADGAGQWFEIGAA
jgi:hypothetical protein